MNSLEERFWSKVDKRGNSECWPWIGAKSTNSLYKGGFSYGCISRTPAGPNKRLAKAHRVAYELLVGSIPDGLTLDHLCKNTLCVNPAHLEPVSQAENILRGNAISARYKRRTHCKRGHMLTEENFYSWPEGSAYAGKRTCRLCHLENSKLYKQRKRNKNK